MRNWVLLVFLGFLILTPAAAEFAGINLLKNGDLSSSPEPGSIHMGLQLPAGSGAISHWTVFGGPVGLMNYRGERMLGLQDRGGIRQTIETEKGEMYKVTFEAHGTNDSPLDKKFGARAGSTTQNWVYTIGARSRGGWRAFSFSFKAVSDESTLEIFSTTGNVHGPSVRRLSVVKEDPLRSQVESLYSSYASRIARRDFSVLESVCGPDFAYRTADNQDLTRDQLSAQLSPIKAFRSVSLSFNIVEQQILGPAEGDFRPLPMVVDEKFLYRDANGRQVVIQARVRHIWKCDAQSKISTLLRSEEVSRQVEINGQPTTETEGIPQAAL